MISVAFSTTAFSIDLKSYINQAIEGRDQIIEAIKGLKKGKREIGSIYSTQLKPQLIDVLAQQSNGVKDQIKSINGAIDPLLNIPGWVKDFIAIGDLQGTLTYLKNTPLVNIEKHLDDTRINFDTIAQKLNDKKIADKFDLSIAKMQSAVCSIEKTLKALKADFVPSEVTRKSKLATAQTDQEKDDAESYPDCLVLLKKK